MAFLKTGAEIEAAIEQGKRQPPAPRATSVTYNQALDALVLHLEGRAKPLTLPRSLLQGLENATPKQIRDIEFVGQGRALHWPQLNADHLVASLAQGILNTALWREQQVSHWRKAGQSRSEAKQAAARINGSKGGRPRQKPLLVGPHVNG